MAPANPTYLGPADSLIVDGKAFRAGDRVPVTADQRAGLELAGHRFEDTDPDAVARAALARTGPPPDTRPRGDRGEVLELPEPRRGAAASDRPSTPPAQA